MSQNLFNENIFLQATKPSRYIGGEINCVKKPWSDEMLKFALAFPEPYEIAMSHLGYQILYSLLNSKNDILCERVFTPWTDMQEVLKKNDMELFSIESRQPVKNFDILGFSLQYEMSFTNVLSILELSGLPLKANDRKKGYPLVIGGGPCTFNPEPIAPFFDAFMIGEAEEAIFEITLAVNSWKKNKSGDKNLLLNDLSSIEGVYIPSFFESSGDKRSTERYLKPLKAGYEKVKKRALKDLPISYLPQKPIIPFMKVTHDRLAIEIQRGCTKGCRFCQAGIIYRPTRQRNTKDIFDYALRTQEKTGIEEISFLSLNSPDHPYLSKICSTLSEKFKGKAVSLSLPSTRLDEFNEELMKKIQSARKTGFTFAPEAGSERLRIAMNKPITDKQILDNLDNVYRSGWNLIKLYFMIGLPGETQNDIEAIVNLSNRIIQLARKTSKRNRLTVNISPFVPKPHTSFQWKGQEDIDSLKKKVDYLKANLKHRSIKLKWNDPEVSAIEALLSKGSRDTSEILLNSYKEGARFDGWSDLFNFDIWKKSVEKSGAKLENLISKDIEISSRLPWDHIDTGVSCDFFKNELEKIQRGELTNDCAFDSCNTCGLCDDFLKPKMAYEEEIQTDDNQAKKETSESFIPLLIYFSKTGNARFLSHLETIKVFERTLRRTGISLKNSSGFHPIPIMRFSRALPIGIESEDEKLLIYSNSSLDIEKITQLLNDNLPEGFYINDICTQDAKMKIELKDNQITYNLDPDNHMFSLDNIRNDLDKFNNRKEFVIIKKTKKAHREVDLKDFILDIQISNGSLKLTIDESTQGINPLFVVEQIFGNQFASNVRIKKTKGQ